MSTRSLGLDDAVHGYLIELSGEPLILRELRAQTAGLPQSGMQISPEQGRFMAWLVGVLGARRYLEVGVFTGYSSLAVALALPEDGTVLACDLNETWTRTAREYWNRAGVASKVELRLGPALDTLKALSRDNDRGPFDLAFIDADKENGVEYYDLCLSLLRPGGVVAVDNALWGGRVASPSPGDASTDAIRALNTRVTRDPRVDACLLPVGDGLLLARKRAE